MINRNLTGLLLNLMRLREKGFRSLIEYLKSMLL
jgi:hypothetical protein